MKLLNAYLLTLLLPSLLFSATTAGLYRESPKPPLKILIIETYFPPVSSTAALNQITGLVKLGHHVDIWAKNRGPSEWAHKDIAKYNLMQHVMFGELPRDLDRYDIIYCMFGYRGKDIIDATKRYPLRHAKIITCFRGADISEYVKKNSRTCYRDLFAQGDLFLPVCDYFKNKLIDLGCACTQNTGTPFCR